MKPSSPDRATNALGAGLTWGISVALFAWLGSWLDGKLGTTPLFLVAGALLGAVGGFIHFVARVAPDVLPFGRKGDPDPPSQPPDPDAR